MPKSHQDRSTHTATFFDYSYVLEKAEAQCKLGAITRDQFLRIQAGCKQKLQKFHKLQSSTKTEKEKEVLRFPTIE
ncbi:MAG: hypothetical protein ACTSYI_11125 [Promethearchaeota archaeon]